MSRTSILSHRSLLASLVLMVAWIFLLQACGGGGGGGGAPSPITSYYAYVANAGSNNISAYTLNAATGVLTPIDADAATPGIQHFAAGTGPYSITLTTSGAFAYVANSFSNNISAYTLNAATGVLTPIDADAATPGIQNFAAGTGPYSITVTPSGAFAYVANQGSNDVSAYTINAATGVLMPIDADAATPGIQNFAAGTGLRSVTVTPSGAFAYVANNNSNDVSAYTINAATGVLTPIDADAATPGIQNFAAGTGPYSITVTPSGAFAYMANQSSNDVSAYTIAATGVLTPIDADAATPGIQNFAAGNQPIFVTVTPSGAFAYVANYTSSDVSAYTINAATGVLTPIDADAATPGIQNFAAGTTPISVTVTPSGAFAYVANQSSIDVSAYTINAATGVLTPIDADAATPGIQNFAAGSSPKSVTTTRVVH